MRIILSSLILSCILFNLQAPSFGKDLLKKGGTKKAAQQRSTLSELGIDFGAAELSRYAELDLTGTQKMEALSVVRDRKPHIEKLCARMTKALKMKEETLEKKQLKEAELAAILEQFRSVQSEIMTGLHALVTPEQKKKLEAIKREEKREQTKAEDSSNA